MIYYLLIGTVWTLWLEWFTTTKLSGEHAQSWKMIERIFTISIWPLSIGVFLYNFFKDNRW